MSDLTALTIAGARAGLAAREVSARELVDAHIAAVEAGRELNAFVAETFDAARTAADAADARLGAGEGRHLEGIPLAVKDLFCTPRGAQPSLLQDTRRLRAALRIDRHRQSVGRRRSHAG